MSHNSIRFPQAYDEDRYVRWHEWNYPKDTPLKSKVLQFRKELPTRYQANWMNLIDLLNHIKNDLVEKVGIIEIPILNREPNLSDVDEPSLYKQDDSIINKLWRKNKANEDISLSNIENAIGDLVRTEIVTESLAAARVAARIFNSLLSKRSKISVKEELKSSFARIRFESKMEPSSGYFAYHGSLIFSDKKKMEIQIYSSIMKSWRKLSHPLYAHRRSFESPKFRFNTIESRLISIGHLLHLAECEFLRSYPSQFKRKKHKM